MPKATNGSQKLGFCLEKFNLRFQKFGVYPQYLAYVLKS